MWTACKSTVRPPLWWLSFGFNAKGYYLSSQSKFLSIVSFSLCNAFEALLTNEGQFPNEQACNAFNAYFANVHVNQERLTFFFFFINVLNSLRHIPETYLGLETGKSHRGLDALLT